LKNKIAISTGALLLFALTGCRDDMHNQPRYKPLAASEFFADHRSERPEVEGTVARGHLRIDSARYTGKVNGEEIDQFPIPINRADIERGRERFNIYCTPCHGRLGDGNGMVVLRGYRQAASYYNEKLMTAPVGHFFDVMTNGFVAYIRALQLSESAKLTDVPEDQRQNLKLEPAPNGLSQGPSQPASTPVPPARPNPGDAR
jgi:hypothetical protein